MSSSLKFKTKGMDNPQGKPRVYFCCHPDDFKRTFTEITDEILDIQKNAAIWYYDASEGIPSDEEFMLDLSQMQLFVVPVTYKFLFQPNQARELEFAYAIDHHIPVLPLMQEEKLEEGFNKICGDIQFLYKFDNDPTAIPYFDKLKKYLESVLVSDELAEQIRNAFVAYIFLSYRKKDRKYANQIMRLIHENEFCRDVAIWYDEFLTPGENFNNAISQAMEKCSLFTLMVTPNLLEENNYVMTIEYPEAKKSGKPILPIETAETDRQGIQAKYEGIGNIVNVNEKNVFSYALKDALNNVVLGSNNSDPKHKFFMGLAYLSGIDVEVDHSKALNLITEAADGNLPEAYEKLVSMYNAGEGVARDYQTAVKWQEKYVEMLEHNFDNPYETKTLLANLWELGHMLTDLQDFKNAEDAYKKMLYHAIKRHQDYSNDETRRDISHAYDRLGITSERLGNLVEAKDNYAKSLSIREEIAQKSDTIETRLDLSSSYYYLGRICEQNDLFAAIDYYEKGLEIREDIVKLNPTSKNHLNLALYYEKIGQISRMLGDIKKQKEYYQKANEIYKEQYEKNNSPDNYRNLSISYANLGSYFEQTENLNMAKEYYQLCCKMLEDLAELTEKARDIRIVSCSYIDLGRIHVKDHNYDIAKDYFHKAYQIRLELFSKNATIESRNDLYVSNYTLGDICRITGNKDKALEYFQKGLEIAKELHEKSKTKETCYNLINSFNAIGNIFEERDNLGEAIKYYLLAKNTIDEVIAPEIKTIDYASITYNNLGGIFERVGLLSEARESYTTVTKARETLLELLDTENRRRDLAFSYNNLARVLENDGDFESAIDYYLKSIEINVELIKKTVDLDIYTDLSLSYKALGDICEQVGTITEAKDYYIKALAINEKVVEESKDLLNYKNVVHTYLLLGNLSEKLDDDYEAKKYYQKALNMSQRMVKIYPTEKAYELLATAYVELGYLGNIDLLRKSYKIIEILADQWPKNPTFSKLKSILSLVL